MFDESVSVVRSLVGKHSRTGRWDVTRSEGGGAGFGHGWTLDIGLSQVFLCMKYVTWRFNFAFINC